MNVPHIPPLKIPPEKSYLPKKCLYISQQQMLYLMGNGLFFFELNKKKASFLPESKEQH